MSEPHDEQSPAEPGAPGYPEDTGDRPEQPAGQAPEPGAGQAPEPGAGQAPDPNGVAIERAEVDARMTEWLRQVAGQVDPRLDRVAPDWRQREQAQAARACVFGLLLAHLARGYPHAREAVHRVVEHHPSYSTLTAGERLSTLERIVAEPESMAAWIGPLIDVTDSERVRLLLD